jgi:hypothetical protein
MRKIVPTCSICGVDNETIHHMLFMCAAARSAWETSPLSIGTPDLPLDPKAALVQLWSNLQGEEKRFACYITWGSGKHATNSYLTKCYPTQPIFCTKRLLLVIRRKMQQVPDREEQLARL